MCRAIRSAANLPTPPASWDRLSVRCHRKRRTQTLAGAYKRSQVLHCTRPSRLRNISASAVTATTIAPPASEYPRGPTERTANVRVRVLCVWRGGCARYLASGGLARPDVGTRAALTGADDGRRAIRGDVRRCTGARAPPYPFAAPVPRPHRNGPRLSVSDALARSAAAAIDRNRSSDFPWTDLPVAAVASHFGGVEFA